MHGEHGGDAAQGQEQVFGGVEQFRTRHEAVEGQASHLPQQDHHAPRFVAVGDGAAGQVGKGSGEAAVCPLIVEQGDTPRLLVAQSSG